MIDDSRVELLSAADDRLHAPSDHPWFFESSWWSFYVPERNLGAWIYHWTRPNQSTQGGGCWLYDDTTWSHLEVPYYACYEHAASGVDTEVLEPLRRYRISFRDRDLIAFEAKIDDSRLEVAGFEASQPKSDGQDDASRARNRRVEIRLLGAVPARGEAASP